MEPEIIYSKEDGRLKVTKTEEKVEVTYHDPEELKISRANLIKDQEAYNDRVAEDIAIIDSLLERAENLGIKEEIKEEVKDVEPVAPVEEEIINNL